MMLHDIRAVMVKFPTQLQAIPCPSAEDCASLKVGLDAIRQYLIGGGDYEFKDFIEYTRQPR